MTACISCLIAGSGAAGAWAAADDTSGPSAQLPGTAPLFTPADNSATSLQGARSALPAPPALDAIHLRHLAALRAGALACRVQGKAAGPTAAEATRILALLQLHHLTDNGASASTQSLFSQAWTCSDKRSAAGLAWCALSGCGGATPDPKTAQGWIDRLLRVDPGRAMYLRWWLQTGLAPIAATDASPNPGVDIPVRNGEKSKQRADRIAAYAAPQILLEQAAALNDTQACNERGIQLFQTGQLAEAVKFFRTASATSPAAKANLDATLKRLKPGTAETVDSKPDQTPAVRAASLLALARRYHRGDGVLPNYEEAIRLYRQAQAAGSAQARRMLELIYSRPSATGGIDPEWMAQLAQLQRIDDGGVLDKPGASSDSLNKAILRRDPTPLYDWLPVMWQARL